MQWHILTSKEELFDSSPSRFHPVAEVLLRNRGYTKPEDQDIFLAPDYTRDVHDPMLFSAMEKVVERVKRAKENKEVVGIFGDFDADGVTSSVILRTVLEELGLQPLVYIPDKLSEGHGLNMKAVDFFAEAKASLIFTLDCGMMNHDEILAAQKKGIDCIVVDHHHVPEVLPHAFAIINPKLKDETYPFRELCGAGTTFKVAHALIKNLKPKYEEQLKWLLDIVAIGTVADVMPLVGENRVLVKYGLLVLSKTRHIGLKALLQEARIDFERGTIPDAELIAFHIAPRINAASRMAHAKIAHDLLMASSESEALLLARQLNQLNVARQKQSSTITKEVVAYMEKEKKGRHFLFAAEPHYPYGIVGLVAGRLANEFQKPVAILTKGEERSRGSFRSIPGFSVIEALEACADILERYGGHEAAAGMHIHNDHLEAFEERFNDLVAAWQSKQEKVSEEKVLQVDIEILPTHVGPELWNDLKKLSPFGEGNREPIFAVRQGIIQSIRYLGKNGEHLKLSLQLGEKVFDAIGFSLAKEKNYLTEGMAIDLAFCLGENRWNGSSKLQLKIVDIQ